MASYTRCAGACTVHAIDLTTAGIGNKTRSYKFSG